MSTRSVHLYQSDDLDGCERCGRPSHFYRCAYCIAASNGIRVTPPSSLGFPPAESREARSPAAGRASSRRGTTSMEFVCAACGEHDCATGRSCCAGYLAASILTGAEYDQLAA